MSRPPSSRVTTWPLTSDADRALWDSWAAALSAARHPSLARVEEVSRTEDLGTLVLADPDSESVTEWAERTGASVPERLAVLRAAAAALDALYAGSESAPGIPHGGVSTDALRVAADGSTRLVGFAPWTGLSADRFRAPELGSRDQPTRAGDVYAFACMTADVLGGSRVAAAADTAAVVQGLRSSPDTRRRARLVRAIQSALSAPPEARPTQLTEWLANAAEGTAMTQVSGTAATAGQEGPVLSAPAARRLLPSIVAVLVALVLVGGWLLVSRGGNDPSTDGGNPVTPSSIVSAVWEPACGAGTGIAGTDIPDGFDDVPTTAHDLDRLTANRVGRWHTGTLLITFRKPPGAKTIKIASLTPNRINRLRDAPSWKVTVSGPCKAPEKADVRLGLDLDTRDLRARIVPGTNPGRRFNPSGAGFVLDASKTVVAVDASACRTNSAWTIDVLFSGSKQKYSLGQFFIYGTAGSTEDLSIGQKRSVLTPLSDGVFDGQDPACSAAD